MFCDAPEVVELRVGAGPPARGAGQREGDVVELVTPQGIVRAKHLVAATGAHNTPVIPPVSRKDSAVREFHSSALRDPDVVANRDVLVVGGGYVGMYTALRLGQKLQRGEAVVTVVDPRWVIPVPSASG